MAALLVALNDFIKTAAEAALTKKQNKKKQKTIVVIWVENVNPRRSTVSNTLSQQRQTFLPLFESC